MEIKKSIINLDTSVDFTKIPIFFGADSLALQRYDKFKYPSIFSFFKQQISFFWRPEEVSLSGKERNDYETLTDHQKFIFTSNLGYQILLDSIQSRGISHLLQDCSNPEVEAYCKAWEFFETIHSYSYTHIIKNVYSNPSDVFDNILKDEEILKRSEANLKIIMDTTDTAYALLDKKLNILDFNQMTVKFLKTQFNKTPFKGDSLSYYFPKEKFPQFIKQIDKVLKGRNISYELNYSQPDGSVFWYYTRLFPITNDQNKIVGLMMAFSDITERKNAEESLKTAYGRIRDQIQSIKDIAWKQSHLIRSPVANLKGLVALLKQDPMNSELINFISTELERLDNVIIDMAGDASNHDL